MLKLSRTRFPHLDKTALKLTNKINDYIDENIALPSGLNYYIFGKSFLETIYYLMFPYLFRNAFSTPKASVTHEICISGYFYFKYLLSMDALIDKDSGGDERLLLMQAHVFHEESMKLLAKHFGKNEIFWELWKKRNNDFLKSILSDKDYNLRMKFEDYAKLSKNKCSFSKVAIDCYYSKSRQKNDDLFNALESSFDYFSIARCLQDDLEDFKNDLEFKNNNWSHVLLNEWLRSNNLKFKEIDFDTLEKYLYTSEITEKVLGLSKTYYKRSIEVLKPYSDRFGDYIKIVEMSINNLNYFKASIQAYRVGKILESIRSHTYVQNISLDDSISLSESYIDSMQNEDGSWLEVCNMQGFSNVWATGFIGAFLEDNSSSLGSAKQFLINHRQDDLWGYNTDWTYDYDSTTCVLMSLNDNHHSLDIYIDKWLKGQNTDGSFRTYSPNNKIISNLNLNRRQIKGWTQGHVCVSAMGYYFLSNLENQDQYNEQIEKLEAYILSTKTKNGVWKPYWWTSYIYPTCLNIQGMINRNRFDDEIDSSVRYILDHQNEDGSFSCELLDRKSLFYSAMILDMLCYSEKIFVLYKDEIERLKDWILKNQLDDGSFEGTNFLVIPNPDVLNWDPDKSNFKINNFGSGNSITGEISGLFTTAIVARGLRRYRAFKS